ncbi:MAG TPA: hypothetical protein PLW09_08900 [Candidatus Kapabacteria bacterium]|nr:hypothetical protein [Candidatus Kapabacteria bacterium]
MAFEFVVSGDAWWESNVAKVISSLSGTGYIPYFLEQNYGTSLENVFVVLMCREPEYNFKRRIRFVKKEKILYMDIMLDLPQFLTITQKEREKIIVDKIITEVPQVIAKYKFKDFDLVRFEKDLKKWMRKIL